ncbi:winged helix-turn-helix domain-containing protein [Ochrobactrum haematophilum]|uniref:Winged helix-turn-helix domain-containing protein n=1 Tax=Brucella haematophila TaxID=419474 RepID=A0ABX1DQU5_9HYPH|nr:winged helix-turn-helix domain-containing protein [Brucella haematophila]
MESGILLASRWPATDRAFRIARRSAGGALVRSHALKRRRAGPDGRSRFRRSDVRSEIAPAGRPGNRLETRAICSARTRSCLRSPDEYRASLGTSASPLLLELFTRYRAQWPGNRIEEMALPLTQEQIGDETGLTFVHVNRVLSSLRKEGIVQFQYRRLRILNPDKLIEVAGVDVEIAKAWLDQNSSRSDDRRRTT